MLAAFDWFATNATEVLVVLTFVLACTAVAQFGLARRTAQRQLRAYVSVDRADFYCSEEGEPSATIVLRNSGQTPARDVVSWASIDVLERRHEETLVPPELVAVSGTTLGANGVLTKFLRFRTLNTQEIADIAAGSKVVYAFGKIEYRDVFGKLRTTSFRLGYLGAIPPKAGTVLNIADRGNDAD